MPIRMASVQEMNVVGDGIHYEISAVLSDPITMFPATRCQRKWYHYYSTASSAWLLVPRCYGSRHWK